MRDKTPFEKGETIHISLFACASCAFLDESTTNDCPVSLNPGWEILFARLDKSLPLSVTSAWAAFGPYGRVNVRGTYDVIN